MKKIIMILGLITLLLTSCEDRSTLESPNAVNTGDADFSKFVTVGNSLTAGYQNGAVYQSAQRNSFGNQISKQLYAGLSFEQPLVSDPGTGNRIMYPRKKTI